MSRISHNWYPISGTYKDTNVQEMINIDKSNKWFHTRRFFQMVFTSYKWYLYIVSFMQDDGSTSDPQL